MGHVSRGFLYGVFARMTARGFMTRGGLQTDLGPEFPLAVSLNVDIGRRLPVSLPYCIGQLPLCPISHGRQRLGDICSLWVTRTSALPRHIDTFWSNYFTHTGTDMGQTIPSSISTIKPHQPLSPAYYSSPSSQTPDRVQKLKYRGVSHYIQKLTRFTAIYGGNGPANVPVNEFISVSSFQRNRC